MTYTIEKVPVETGISRYLIWCRKGEKTFLGGYRSRPITSHICAYSIIYFYRPASPARSVHI